VRIQSFRGVLAVAPIILSLLACQLPAGGTPVYVDMRAGEFWSGDAKLLEVSDDETRCRIAARDKTLVVKERWVDCANVHAKSVRQRATPEASPKSSFR